MRPAASGARRTLASVPMQICRRQRRRKFDMPLSSFKRVDPHSLTLRACRRVRGSQHRSRRRSVPRLPLPSSAGGRREYKRFVLDRPIAACNFTRLLLSPTPPARRRRPQGQSNGRTNCMHSHPSFFLLIIAMQGGVRRASPGREGQVFLEPSAQRPLRKFTSTKVRATSSAGIGNECACH